jgi:hypothetical protein
MPAMPPVPPPVWFVIRHDRAVIVIVRLIITPLNDALVLNHGRGLLDDRISFHVARPKIGSRRDARHHASDRQSRENTKQSFHRIASIECWS